MISNDALMDMAKKASENAYAPYSKFKVGAALLTKTGRVFVGSNVENASFGATICAERTAISKAVSEGEREFSKIAVFADSNSAPCGICRQILAEFSGDIQVIFYDKERNIIEKTAAELLPYGFEIQKG